jgi:hypothetical protein
MVKARTDKKRVVSNEAREELEREFKHLRVLVREIGENFILRREGEIETAIGNLEGLPPGKLRAMAPALIEELRKLKVKPAKGRFKDLKELNRMIDALAGRVITAQNCGKGLVKG